MLLDKCTGVLFEMDVTASTLFIFSSAIPNLSTVLPSLREPIHWIHLAGVIRLHVEDCRVLWQEGLMGEL